MPIPCSRCTTYPPGVSGRAAITTRAPQPSGAAENLVIGEHAQRRHDEAAIEGAHRQRRPIGAEQLVQSLELPFVVAEDHSRRWLGDDLPESLQVTVDVLRRGEWKALLGLSVRHRDARQAG